ncbi:MAG: transposase [Planctomycetota bacterium]
MSEPLAFLITFRTYGSWLHGDPRGSVDNDHNIFDTPMLDPKSSLSVAESNRLRHPPVALTEAHRSVVADAIRRVCDERHWTLSALNVRSNHIHAVVSAPDSPERVMHALKSFATRALRESGLAAAGTRLWSRHGSTRYLWEPRELEGANFYVVESQGPDRRGEL